jgi:regulator of protease activity HflC (stomatin/prohibitin superfamily)
VDTVTIAGVILLVVVLLVLAFLTIRVVTEYDRLVVFRLGKTGPLLVKGPGVVFLIPVVDRPVRIDLREQFIEVPSQTTITKDNAPINIDFLIYWRVVDPLKSIVNVAYFAGALQGIATTTLRSVIGDIPLDDVLSKRDQITEVLRAKLDEQTERWGGKITTVEIREITPPRDVQEAMNRMLSAERNRRAVITESEGARQANINVAEGEKQAAILRSEGSRQSQILQAEGFSLALSRIFSAARGIDERTMTLQYLEALKVLGAGAATKFIFPLEFSRLAERIASYVETGMSGEGGGGGDGAPLDGGAMGGDDGGGTEPSEPTPTAPAPMAMAAETPLPSVSIPSAVSAPTAPSVPSARSDPSSTTEG